MFVLMENMATPTDACIGKFEMNKIMKAMIMIGLCTEQWLKVVKREMSRYATQVI